MDWNIIVASNDAYQLDELINGAKEIASRLRPRVPALVRTARSIDELRTKRNSKTRLLIVAACLPQFRSGGDDDRDPGISFLESLGSESVSPPSIVVSERIEHYRKVQTIERCELLLVDNSTNYIEQCLQLAHRLGIISEGPAQRGDKQVRRAAISETGSGARVSIKPLLPEVAGNPTFALLEVDLLSDVRMSTVSLEIHYPGRVEKKEAQPLGLSESNIDQLMKECKELRDKLSDGKRWSVYYDKWHADYRSLGERLSNLLWGSGRFKEYYHYGSGAAQNNVRIRFNLDQPWFPGFWEAISLDWGERRLIMLENTVTRRARGGNQTGVFSNESGQIDAEDGVLNVLVIKSNVPDGSTPNGPDDMLWKKYWESYGGTLPQLEHLDDEEKVLRDLRRLPKRPKVGGGAKFKVNVDVLPVKLPVVGTAWSLAAETQRWLSEKARRYDIVHFAGHALFADGPERDARGYLVFSGFPKPEAVPISIVATWLADAGVQLVYLSCCQSSAASAALEFARNSIPMAIGFHWDLDDSKAPVFAKHFYEALLKAKLKVCPAVSKARLELYNQHLAGDPIWASPILIAQPMNWIQVEGVLKLAANKRQGRTKSRGTPQPLKLPSLRRRGTRAA